MPRVCTVCAHPERHAIDRALVAGEAAASVAARYRTKTGPLGRMAVQRHREEHVPAALAQTKAAADVANADAIMAELRRALARVNLLFDACDRWLRDPDNPDQYDVGPRAHDVTVLYSEPDAEGRDVRKKARLSELLAKVASDGGITIDRAEYRHADPRELVLKTAAQVQHHLELLTKLLETGELEARLRTLEDRAALRGAL